MQAEKMLLSLFFAAVGGAIAITVITSKATKTEPSPLVFVGAGLFLMGLLSLIFNL